MNYKRIGRIIAQILAVEAIFMLPALLLCLFDGDLIAARAFASSVGIIAASAMLLWLVSRNARDAFYAREGLVCASVSWIVMSLLGCLPFCLSGAIPRFVDALFEMVSGFTTTGASILPAVEGLPRGILYWRSFSHWLGGMGVLVFVLAIAPANGNGDTLHLLRAESPGPVVGKLVPKIRRTAEILYLIYILLTLLNFVMLLIGKMPWFDAMCTAFGTAGTGGFGIRNDSMAGYSPYLQNVCTVFMLLFGVNFSCYYLLLCKNIRAVFKDEELRLYVGVALVATLLITLNLGGFYATIGETLRHAAFQVSSIMTTTGFATTNFDLWPSFSKAILLALMVAGACAGSTGGGIKCGRLVLLGKIIRRDIRQALHPQDVQHVHMNGQIVDERVLKRTSAYLACYMLIVVLSFIVISLDGLSVTTNLAAVLSCFNNIGPGLETVGPSSNYGMYSSLSKIVLSVDMLAGRLEIIPIVVLFSHHTWKR